MCRVRIRAFCPLLLGSVLLNMPALAVPGSAEADTAVASATAAATDTSTAARDGSGDRDDHYYFYHHHDYGSDSLIHPLRLIINGGYGIMQLENRHNRPLDIHYDIGTRNVLHNLAHPFAAIEVHGWWDFVSREIIPISSDPSKAQYWPNYTQHLIAAV